ncbi:hypothetical protein MBLNU13_g10691t1 [Cladosporium sp. NU13]
MSTSHANNTVQQPSRLLTLPGEIRNSIYELVLAEVQDSICIDLEGGHNKIHKVSGKNRSVPSDDNTSRLSLLLTCKQVNTEATGIAFSKMSMSMDTVFPKPSDLLTRCDATLTEGSERLNAIMANFLKVFTCANLACIQAMHFPRTEVLLHLVSFNSPFIDVQHSNASCTAKCASLSYFQGLVHELFHNVKRIIINVEDRQLDQLYRHLTKGASWLSVTMQPGEAKEVLGVFSNLEEIVVRRSCGEQVSKVIDGKIYAAESGMEMLGSDDWLRNIPRRRT